MKKILFLTLICSMLFAIDSHAAVPERYTKQAADTSVNQDTTIVVFNAIPSNIRALQATVTKVSGTVSGYVVLEGTIDGNNWMGVMDTLSVTNQATNIKVWLLTSTSYYSYRIRYVTPSGTQVSTLAFTYMRRPDE